MEMGSTLRAGSCGVQVNTVDRNEVGTMASKRPNQPKPPDSCFWHFSHIASCDRMSDAGRSGH